MRMHAEHTITVRDLNDNAHTNWNIIEYVELQSISNIPKLIFSVNSRIKATKKQKKNLTYKKHKKNNKRCLLRIKHRSVTVYYIYSSR